MSAAKSVVVRRRLRRRPKDEPGRRSGCFVKLDRNAGSGDPPQRGAANIGAADAVNFEIETDNRVGLIFLGLADQRAHGRQTIGLSRGRFDSTPSRGRLDAAD
jgi:hypothetical protein